MEYNFLNPEEVFQAEELLIAETNVSFYRKNIAGGFKPRSQKSVEAIVKWANETKAKLYPFSKGSNWAFGSKLPVGENNFLLDLSHLNQIFEFNNELGFIKIGPGVTQGQVSDFLESQQSDFFLDVTGSGRETSIIGNALERGIAYNSLRSDYILNFEILLGNGDIIQTGFQPRMENVISHLYPYGIGPHLDQIFFQSNFGIILSATYLLHPKPPAREAVQINFKEEDLGRVIQKLKLLLQNGTLDCIVHLADPYRGVSTITPLLPEESKASYYQKTIQGQKWTGLASIYGTKEVVKAKLKEVKKELSPFCKLVIFNEQKADNLQKISGILGLKSFSNFLAATKGLRGFVRGKATNDSLHMAAFNPKDFQNKKHDSLATVDFSERGLLFCVPLAPLTPKCCQDMVALVRDFSKKHPELDFGMTLNTLNEKVVEAVISLHFDKPAKEKAHLALVGLYELLIAKGFPPYRLNPGIMGILPIKNNEYQNLLQRFKLACDPNKILSPGRYLNHE
jgi:4-cresol dehydrogenase (hydroxylating)